MREARVFDALPLGDVGEGTDLNAEIVFEIKYSGSVTEIRFELMLRRGDQRVWPLTKDLLSTRKRIQPLLFAVLLCRSRDRDMASWTGFAGIVRG